MTSRSNKKNLFKLFTISLVLGMLVCEGCDLNRSKTNSTSVQKDPDGNISKDTLEINGVKGGEIITRKILESGQILYNLNIQLYYENNMVHLIYMVGAPTETEAAEVFEQQKTIFEHLAKRTKFYRSVKS